jgi:choline kinase
MRALILAAGDGDRLHPLTDGTPKPLLALRGRPIINHILDALAVAGVDDATVVVGYRAEQMRSALQHLGPPGMTVRFVDNPDYQHGNARSLWAAREAMLHGGGFVLVMGDHLVEPALIGAVARDSVGRCRLAVDRAGPGDPRAEEATRALVRDDRVVDLGKTLDDWNALDTGVFWCTPLIFDAITPALRDGEAGAVFAAVAHAGELDAVDVTGSGWIDIDTAGDLRAAEAFLEPRARA